MNTKAMKSQVIIWGLIITSIGCSGSDPTEFKNTNDPNGYSVKVLTANSEDYEPEFVDSTLGNSWGIAIRPAGFGGHFWVTNANTGISTEYVGDVSGKRLYQDELATVTIPPPPGSPGSAVGQPTGVVFNQSQEFVITQQTPSGPISGPAKFIFATNDGTLAAWTEKKNSDGSFNRPADSILAVDNSGRGDDYFGIAITNKSSGNLLYVADFGADSKIRVFNSNFQEVTDSFKFENPFENRLYVPFNIQAIGSSLFIVYAKSSGEAGEETQRGGLGRLVEYDFNGNLKAIWDDGGLLNAPWGIALAPSTGFGKFSGHLLITNFGDEASRLGSIVAFNVETKQAVDYLRDGASNPVYVPGIWGIIFGNGASLGEANHLYFAAGPKGEEDGVFGKIIPPAT
ncbi:TIGR03118 family protein [bacterium]|nr:TIGR03118 family protein [bacterium]